MYLDIVYVAKTMYLEKSKTPYNLEQMDYELIFS
jgi:hypothetical protein